MKLSIPWIFDHIDAPATRPSLEALVYACNQTVAEIEHYGTHQVPVEQLSIAQIVHIAQNEITVFSPEWGQEYTLAVRTDAQQAAWYFMIRDDQKVGWATASSFGSSKPHILPALSCTPDELLGGWKMIGQQPMAFIELDNKSITHRPDLWGHRGFAREIATLCGFSLKPLEPLLVSKTRIPTDQLLGTTKNTVTITNQAGDACKAMAALTVSAVSVQPSTPSMVIRLSSIDQKSINSIVDATNYVMFDLGQPMHAFDAQACAGTDLVVRYAQQGEKIAVLDGTQLTLTAQDLLVSNGPTPLSLAGIIGGSGSAVRSDTQALIIEAGCFNPAVIRRSSLQHHVRTESSARFEKGLEASQTPQALERFLKLMTDMGVAYTAGDVITIDGLQEVPATVIEVGHHYIEQRIGMPISASFVRTTLTQLGFDVQEKDSIYFMTPPRARAQEITLVQDCIEELARYLPYSALVPELPYRQTIPSDIKAIEKKRAIKNIMAYGLGMREIASYALYDEEFLVRISYAPEPAPEVKSPVSEHWKRLVGSLTPHLLKAVAVNSADHDSLRFFEWARTWRMHGTAVTESTVLGAIFFHKKKPIDFYEVKAAVMKLLNALSLDVSWKAVECTHEPWYMPYQTAHIWHNDTRIGTVGKILPDFLRQITEGDACVVELDAHFLQQYAPVKRYKAPAKYPAVERDMSMLLDVTFSVDELKARVFAAHETIKHVELRDFFTKPEWRGKRSITLRCTLQDEHKTLTTSDIDRIMARAQEVVVALGAQIR